MHFLSSVACAAVICASAVYAAPAAPPPLAGPPASQWTNCDVSGLSQPLLDPANATDNLPGPSGKLIHIALGSGTQNYTCTNNVWTAQGAQAWLYDASCLAVRQPSALLNAPAMVASSTPGQQSTFLQMYSQMFKTNFLLGFHDFEGDFATPNFHLPQLNQLFVGGVDVKMPAPTTSYPQPGQTSAIQPTLHGVAWLKLKPKGTASVGISQVYRIVTAGGAPPAGACSTGAAPIKIPYSALYYFYA